jgi:hypothetical protein
MTRRVLFIIGLPLLVVLVVVCFQERRTAQLERQLTTLRTQLATMDAAQRENVRLQEQLKSATEETQEHTRELMRLRADKIALQNENKELKAASPAPRTPVRPLDPTSVPEPQPYHFTQDQSDYFTERLDFGKKVGLALQKLAEANGGQLPEDLKPVARWLATNYVPVAGDAGPLFGIGTRNFELVYKGNLNSLMHPEQMILAREVDPVEIHEGRWNRMYVFADGSVQRLEATTADGFRTREQEVWPGQP